MHIFIWHQVSEATHNYHSEAGVAIIAESLEAARGLAVSEKLDGFAIPADSEILTNGPDEALALKRKENPRIMIWPNAGCC